MISLLNALMLNNVQTSKENLRQSAYSGGYKKIKNYFVCKSKQTASS